MAWWHLVNTGSVPPKVDPAKWSHTCVDCAWGRQVARGKVSARCKGCTGGEDLWCPKGVMVVEDERMDA